MKTKGTFFNLKRLLAKLEGRACGLGSRRATRIAIHMLTAFTRTIEDAAPLAGTSQPSSAPYYDSSTTKRPRTACTAAARSMVCDTK
jgi:hypothetical protein